MLAAELFSTLPTVGQYLRCPGKVGTALLLSTVRKIGGDTKPMVRLIGLRLRAVNLPPNAEILPWPKARGGWPSQIVQSRRGPCPVRPASDRDPGGESRLPRGKR